MSKVAVFGAGSWGTAFSLVLADAGNDVTIWGRRAEVCVPRGWAGRKLSLTEIEKPASPVAVQPAAGSSSVSIELRPRTAYVLRPGH